MENTHGNRSFPAETTRSGPSLCGLPDIQFRRQYPRHETNSLLIPPHETLVSAFSRLDVNRDYCYGPPFNNLSNHGFFSLDSQETEQRNQNCSSLNLQNCGGSPFGFLGLQNCNFDGFVSGWDSTSNNFSQIRSKENGFLRDYRDGELNNEFSMLPYSNRNMLDTMMPKNQAVTRSGLTIKRDSLSLGGFRGNVVAFAKDQSKSSHLQKIMSGLRKEDIDMIFLEVIDRVCELMIDPSGNYVVQRLIEMCTEEQRTQILLMLTKVDFQLVRICLNMNGSRAVLKLLEKLTTPQQISLVATALSAGAVALTKDTNGHHVIQHCLKHFSDEDNKYLLNVVADNCYGIATDKSGCCVLQHCVEYSKGEQRDRLVAEIIANALLLAEDCYGNYVVQHILGLRVPKITANLLRQLVGHYTSLSCNKYGSNVVEKCLVESGEQQSMGIIMELLGSPNVSMLLMDPFGNYVIQSALSVSQGIVYDALRKLIKMHSPMMRSNIYGKKVLAWFERKRLSYI